MPEIRAVTSGVDDAGRVVIDFDRSRLDLDVIHRVLSTEAYWSIGIPRATIERAVAGSLCVGAYRDEGQVGFARAVTDGATFAYVADVFVVEAERGRGIGKRMVGALLARDELQGLRRILLFTADAHALYRGFGFVPLAKPERGMEIARPDVYRIANDVARDTEVST